MKMCIICLKLHPIYSLSYYAMGLIMVVIIIIIAIQDIPVKHVPLHE